jgi:succinate dehydrogenase / fumarate reductase cytochrome b subunit
MGDDPLAARRWTGSDGDGAGASIGASSAGAPWIRTGSAASGLMLVLFLLLHLAGVALAPLDPQRFEAYAAALHRSAWLPLAELALLAVALVHLGLSLARVLSNRRAGNTAVLRSRRGDGLAALAARGQAAGGAVLLGFLVVHLQQLRWPRPAAGAELASLQAVLTQPLNLLLYLAAALALALHLLHGGEAAHRSLGLLNPANGGRIRRGARVLAMLLGAGFAGVTAMLALVLPLAPAGAGLP